MKNFKKLLRISICSLILISSFGCSKKETKENEVVRIKDAVLTDVQIDSLLAGNLYSNKFREEFINDWIRHEVLFQEAKAQGILDNKKYQLILEQSKKELAAAFLIDKLIQDASISVSDEEINTYFESNKGFFALKDDLCKINIAEFNSFDKASNFRSSLLESSWQISSREFLTDSSNVLKENELVNQFQLQPLIMLRIVKNMIPNEVSIIIQTEQSKFAVVQLVQKFYKDSIPPLEIVKNDVKEKLLISKHKDYVKDYIENLISQHDLEIKRYN